MIRTNLWRVSFVLIACSVAVTSVIFTDGPEASVSITIGSKSILGEYKDARSCRNVKGVSYGERLTKET